MDDVPMTPMDYLAVIRRRTWSLILPAVIVIIAGLYNLHRERVRRAAERRDG